MSDPVAAPADRARISAVIATVGRPEVLRRGLAALLAADPGPDEIVVVDGDAEHAARAVVDDLDPDRRIISYQATARGLTRQRNHALDVCRGDVVAFFDDDARVEPDVFAWLHRIYADPAVVGATGLVIEPASNRVGGKESRIRRLLPGRGPEGTFTRYGYPNRLVHVDQARDIEFMQGAFMTARLDAARQVRFDEQLPGYGLAEDEDFSCRLARVGRIRYEPAAVVHHDNLGVGTRDTRAFGHQVVGNRAYLLRKNFAPTPVTWAQFGLLIGILLVHRLANRDLAGVRGLLEGVWALRHPAATPPSAGTGTSTGIGGGGGGRIPRVAFVSSHAQLGGSERYLEQLLAELAGHDGAGDGAISGVALLDGGAFAGALRQRGWSPAVIRTGASPVAILGGARRLRRWLRQTRPEVVHANGVKAALVAVLATSGTGVPVVWVKHDFSWDGRLGRAIASRCRDVVGVSAAVVSGLPAQRTHVVHTGIEVPPVDRAASRASLERLVGGTGPYVGLVGRLHPVKGHRELLDAVPALAARHPGLRVVLAGGEDPTQPAYAAELRRRVAELAPTVALVGHVDDPFGLLAGADVAVVCSVQDERGMGREGFGLVALEAMAVGTPVVAYADGAVPEVVGDCARLVPPGDRAGLADAIIQVIDDAALADRLRRCGCERVAQQFTVERWVAGMVDRYRAAVS